MDFLDAKAWEEIFEQAIEHLQRLIQIKTVNPPGNEKPAVEYLAEVLRKEGVEPEIFEPAPGRANLVARLKGRGEKPPILIDGHLDVVPAEPESAWKYPPFSGELAEGYIWGRGALDMKQAVVANLMAILVIKKAGNQPRRDLIFTAVADEEAGGKYGAQWLVENQPDLIKAEYGLGEMGGFNMEISGKSFYPVEVAEKGVCWLRVKAKGEPGHGSLPNKDSAVIKLARVIKTLGETKLPYHLTPQVEHFINRLRKNLGGIQGKVLGLLLNPRWSNLVIDRLLPDPSLRRTFWAMLHNTANPTVIRAGEKTNVIPSEAVCEVDGRILPGQSPEGLVEEVRKLIGKDYELEIINRLLPMAQDPNDPILEVFERNLKKYDPQAIVIPNLIPGFTNGSHYARLGIKYFGFTPVQLAHGEKFAELFHGINERIPVEGYKFGLKVFLNTVWDLVYNF